MRSRGLSPTTRRNKFGDGVGKVATRARARCDRRLSRPGHIIRRLGLAACGLGVLRFAFRTISRSVVGSELRIRVAKQGATQLDPDGCTRTGTIRPLLLRTRGHTSRGRGCSCRASVYDGYGKGRGCGGSDIASRPTTGRHGWLEGLPDALFVDSTAALHSTSGLVGSMYPGSSAHVEDDGGGASVKGPFAVLALLAASCVALTTDAAPCADGSPHSLKWDVDWGSSRWRRRPQSPSSPSMVEKVAAAASTSGLAFTASPRRPGSAPQRAGGATI
eukprot:scaffold241559_cov27-Tisochrysis_lutea.AAC.4